MQTSSKEQNYQNQHVMGVNILNWFQYDIITKPKNGENQSLVTDEPVDFEE